MTVNYASNSLWSNHEISESSMYKQDCILHLHQQKVKIVVYCISIEKRFFLNTPYTNIKFGEAM